MHFKNIYIFKKIKTFVVVKLYYIYILYLITAFLHLFPIKFAK